MTMDTIRVQEFYAAYSKDIYIKYCRYVQGLVKHLHCLYYEDKIVYITKFQ